MAVSIRQQAAAATRARSRFFLLFAVGMIAIMFWGFAPTFYLRPFFGAADRVTGGSLPVHLVLHGLALSAWFTLFLAQSLLVATRRLALHRALGCMGVALAVAVISISAVTSRQAISRTLEIGGEVAEVSSVIVSNLTTLLGFALFVACAVYFRRKPLVHKRLMLLASILILKPALSTARPIGEFLQATFPWFGTTWYGSAWSLALLAAAAVVGHDIIEHRRVLPVTIWGGVAIAVLYAVTLAVVYSGAGTELARWMV